MSKFFLYETNGCHKPNFLSLPPSTKRPQRTENVQLVTDVCVFV